MVNFQQIKESARKSYVVCNEIITHGFCVFWETKCQACGRTIESQESGEIICEEYLVCIDCFNSIMTQIEEGF